jgi:hypothetical protein
VAEHFIVLSGRVVVDVLRSLGSTSDNADLKDLLKGLCSSPPPNLFNRLEDDGEALSAGRKALSGADEASQ